MSFVVTTTYKCIGQPQDMESLWLTITSLIGPDGELSIEQFAAELGETVTDDNEVYFRGRWLSANFDGRVITFEINGWKGELWRLRHLIKKRYPSITVYYKSICSEVDIYVTNDAEGRLFPERYILECEVYDEEFVTEADLKSEVESLIERKLKSGENPDAALQRWSEDNDSPYWLAEMTIYTDAEEEARDKDRDEEDWLVVPGTMQAKLTIPAEVWKWQIRMDLGDGPLIVAASAAQPIKQANPGAKAWPMALVADVFKELGYI